MAITQERVVRRSREGQLPWIRNRLHPVTERAMPAHQPVIVAAHPVMPAPDPDPIEVPVPSYTHQINPSAGYPAII